MPQLKHLPASAAGDAIASLLASDGALVLDDVICPELLGRVRHEIEPFVEATPVGRDSFTGFSTTRTGAIIARSPACRELVMHAAILAACDAFLLRACDRYQINATQVIRLKPGQPRQVLHRDRLVWGGFVKEVEPQLGVLWAISAFTKANGATQVVPGSNAWPEGRRAEPAEIAYAEMRPGSALVYSGSVIHGGGENRSEGDRVGIGVNYCLGWLRQEENQYLSCPPAIARTLDPKLQALLGYAMAGYGLGYFSPPLPPGEGPEAVPPEAALGVEAAGWGGDELLEAVGARQREAATA